MSRAQLTSTVEQNSAGAAAPFLAGKNKIINGDFNISQRGSSFSGPGVFAYTIDRWQSIVNGAPTFTVSQQAFTPGNTIAGYESAYFLRQNVTAVSGSSVIAIQQPIEDVRTFAGQTVTLSFWAKADAARTWSVRLDQSFGSGGSSSVSSTSYNLSITTSWQRFVTTISVPSISGKTIGTGSTLGVLIFGASNTVQTMDLWGVQLEAGSVATPFTTATGTLQGELAAAMRYYQRYGNAGYIVPAFMCYFGSSTAAYGILPLVVAMRTGPSGSPSSGAAVTISTNGSYANTSAITCYSSSPTAVELRMTYSGTSVTGQAGMVEFNNNGYLEYSAEL